MKALAIGLFCLNVAQAQDPYYVIKNVRMTEIESSEKEMNSFDAPAGWGEVLQIAKDIVALGHEVYTIVKASEPQLKTSLAPLSVVPKTGDDSYLHIEKWRGPLVKRYEFVMENMLGLDVVTFTYKVHSFYGGRYQGKGQYIKGFAVIPEYVQVLPGYDLDATLSLIDIANMGSVQDPLPAMTTVLKMNVNGPIDVQEYGHTFKVKGDGILYQF